MRSDGAATVIVHKSALMQQIQDYVRVGYRHYCSGTVSHDRAQSWVRKAAKLYDIYLDRNRRARAKKRGEGCAVLLLYPIGGSATLWWILLVTGGEHPAHQLEALNDAWDRTLRITLPDGYELCYLTKPGVEEGRPVLTWRMNRGLYESWRTHIIDTLRRGNDPMIRQLIASLHAAPGFYGVRMQVKACRRLIRTTWKRLRPLAPPLLMPARVYYLRRRIVVREPLAAWTARIWCASPGVIPVESRGDTILFATQT